ncbi:MAG: hypothetical protein RSD76_06010 [Clostridia bacterium]
MPEQKEQKRMQTLHVRDEKGLTIRWVCRIIFEESAGMAEWQTPEI